MIAKYQNRLEPQSSSPRGKYSSLMGLGPEQGRVQPTQTGGTLGNTPKKGGETRAYGSSEEQTEVSVLDKFTRVTRLWMDAQSLRGQLRERQYIDESMIGHVLSDKIAPFILHKIVEAGTMELRRLHENLTAPYGWLALGKLLQARMIDVYGEIIVPTDAGLEFIAWFEREQEDASVTETYDE